MLWCAPTHAAVTHRFLFSFNGSETPAGTLGSPSDITVDAASGDVYVADSANGVIDEFTATGGYICQITGAGESSASPSECDKSHPGAPSGNLSGVRSIAVDNSDGPSAGDVYSATSDEIDKFSPTGGFMSRILLSEIESITVDGYGNVWIGRNGSAEDSIGEGYATITEFAPNGTHLLEFAVSDSRTGIMVVDYGTYIYRLSGHTERSEIEADRVVGDVFGSFSRVESCEFCGVGLATDQSMDHSYVLDRVRINIGSSQESSRSGHITEFDQEAREVAQFGSTELEVYTSSEGALAINPASGYIYAAFAEGANPSVFVYGPSPGPRSMLKSPTDIQTRSVTINATVNPNNADTTYQFEWGASRRYGNDIPIAPAGVGSGTSYVPVGQTITGLTPGTTYHYRIVAKNTDGTTTGADGTFTTKPIPVVDEARSVDVTATSADMVVKINPKGNQASYHVEYGASTSYDQSTPEVAIGAGEEDVVGKERLNVLTPNTTYHWRVVVSYPEGGSSAQVFSADHQFIYLTEASGSTGCADEGLRTGASSSLPECRAYELVTPANKNGAVFGLGAFILPPSVSEDGSRMIAHSIQPLGGAEAASAARLLEGEPYELARTPGGWRIIPLAPPADKVRINTEFGANADTGAALFSGPTLPGNQDDFYLRHPDGSFVDIGPAYPPSLGAVGVPLPGPVGFTPEYLRLLYEVGSDHEWGFDTTITVSGPQPPSLYEYVGSGNTEPVLVGVVGGPASTKLESVCGTVGGGVLNKMHDISKDGRMVYFTALGHDRSGCSAGSAAPATDQLYARREVSETVPISVRSPSECSGACITSVAGDAEFEGASEDGTRAFFLDTQQLTNSATQGSGSTWESGCSNGAACNLYLYDFSAPEGNNLITVSTGDTSSVGPRVQGVIATSPDGTHVYFVAEGVLTTAPNKFGATAERTADNLYLYERDGRYPEGHIAFIARLSKLDAAQWKTTPPLDDVTPNGRFLVFSSHADLTPDDISPSDAAQVFRYDSESEMLTRISIGERGFNDNGNAGAADASIGQESPYRSDPTMSRDADHVFFQSAVGLTPQALNMKQVGTAADQHTPTYAQNIYEWVADGVGACRESPGCIYLISDGSDTTSVGENGGSAVKLIGSDTTGQNVFFSTVDSLAAQDTDTQLDYYDARVDGGFAVVEATPECDGETCQGSPSPQLAFGPLSSVLLTGSGNIPPHASVPASKPKTRHCTKGEKTKHGKCVRVVRKKHRKTRRGRQCPSPTKVRRGEQRGGCAKAVRAETTRTYRAGRTRKGTA